MINDILHAVLGSCCCRGYWRCFTIIFTVNSFSPRSIHIQVQPADMPAVPGGTENHIFGNELTSKAARENGAYE